MQLQQNARFGINKDYKYYLVDKYTACGIIRNDYTQAYIFGSGYENFDHKRFARKN